MIWSRLAALVLALGTTWMLGGCVAHHEVAAAIGPAPPSPPPTPGGFLRVYTPIEVHRDGGIDFRRHRDFSILSPDGTSFDRVRNAEHFRDETPALTPLAVGSYKVRSWTRRDGIVTIPVVIELGRTTEVFLDGSFPEHGSPGDEYVRLPGGEVAGWRVRSLVSP